MTVIRNDVDLDVSCFDALREQDPVRLEGAFIDASVESGASVHD